MVRIPTLIKEYISNADYYLEAERRLPHNAFNAVHILLLLTAWENIQIASEELHHWIDKTKTAKELYKSHTYKFRDIRASKSIDRIILGKPGTKAKTISYSKASDFGKLIKICRYGYGGESKKLESIFEKHWFFDDFRNHLISKIGWEKALIKALESLPSKKSSA